MSDEHEYSYDWDIRYCYENSNVLRNKLGIVDANALRTAEREIAAVRVLEAERTPIRGKLDFKHLCDIHRYIFGDIYEWAGSLRMVNIAKGNPFCNCEALDVYGAELFGKLKAENYLLGTPRERIPERLAHYLSEINVLHPFREGGTRAVAAFTIKYLRSFGYDLTDDTFERHSRFFRNALVRADYDNAQKGVTATLEYLNRFFGHPLFNEGDELHNRELHI